MWPADLPPPIPYVEQVPVDFVSAAERMAPLLVANNSGLRETPEKRAFEKAVDDFQISLSELPANHKAAIAKLHEESDRVVDQKREQGVKADKLSTFIGKVMAYSHERLLAIEKHDPQLTKLRAEYDALSKVFYDGDQVLNTYLAWVRTDD